MPEMPPCSRADRLLHARYGFHMSVCFPFRTGLKEYFFPGMFRLRKRAQPDYLWMAYGGIPALFPGHTSMP